MVYRMSTPASRKRIQMLFWLMVLNAFLELGGIASLLPFVTIAAEPNSVVKYPALNAIYQSMGFENPIHFMVFLGLTFVVVFFVASFCAAATIWLSYKVTFQISHELSCELLNRYLGRPRAWLLLKSTSELANDVLSETDKLVMRLILKLAELLTNAMAAGFVVIGIVVLDPIVALSTAVMLTLVYSQIYKFYKVRLTKAGEERKKVNNLRYKITTEALSSIKEARLPGRLPAFVKAYRECSALHRDALTAGETISDLPRYVTEALAIGSIVLVLIYLVIARPESAVAMLSIYAMAIWRLVPAAQRVYRHSVQIKLFLPALVALSKELEQENPKLDEIGEPLGLEQTIGLKEVTFQYPEAAKESLDNVTLFLKRGEWLALIGPSGSGKTTIAEIISGLLTPTSGQVLIDDKPLSVENLSQWWQNVGYVPQEIYLVDGSITKNIALGFEDSEICEEQVQQAAKLAQIHHFITAELEQGYDSLVGERGVALSGGQRQRLGIARALYHRPELLILDEATAALDAVVESKVLAGLKATETTVLYITHRLSTVKTCDQVAVIKDGSCSYHGSWEELQGKTTELELESLLYEDERLSNEPKN